ncbi:TNT domain-containing protein [Arthrobacter sp. V4I6]|uniref:TNT domain-containing protein n=1 Tax=unclassified Arthrobacter TaxID=235627 RepID=UPI0035944EE0
MDRYGLPRGNFTSPVGENFPDRALPDFSLEKFGRRDGYHQYEVLHEIPAWAGPAAPAFGKAGGATQYYTNLKINELLDKGFIREVTA